MKNPGMHPGFDIEREEKGLLPLLPLVVKPFTVVW